MMVLSHLAETGLSLGQEAERDIQDLLRQFGGISFYRGKRALIPSSHPPRVAKSSWMLAHKLGYRNRDEIALAGLLHDVGKAYEEVPLAEKMGDDFSDYFRECFRNAHCKYGPRMLDMIDLGRWSDSRDLLDQVCLYHHRPDEENKKQNRRPEIALISIADCFDAMTEDRKHRKAHTFETAATKIWAGAQKGLFDKDIARVFLVELLAFPIENYQY